MRILMIGNNLGIQSGVQRYIQNLLLHMDTQTYQVDLLAGPCPPNQQSTGPALEAHGVHWYSIPDDDKKRLPVLAKFLRTHKGYDIVHLHTASKVNALACVLIRLYCPGAKLIVHSHIVYPPMTLVWRMAHGLYQCTAHWFLGCGVAAGRFVFGDHIDRKTNFTVACNAVDKGRFHPDEAARNRVRAQYHIPDSARLCGFVGRYNHQKNLLFLLDVFAAMAKADDRWQLMMVGGGEDQKAIDEKIARLGLAGRVTQTGVQEDIPAFMNAFDLFLLPSNFEGSPITLVEAQGCGTPCLASTNVPDDGAVTDLVHFLPLDAPLDQWAAAADKAALGGPHADHWAELEGAGYEQQEAALRMQALYELLAGVGSK